MQSIAWHFFRRSRLLLFFLILVLLNLFIKFNSSVDVTGASNTLIFSSITLSMAYAGMIFLNLIFIEHQQGSIFLLLASPHRRSMIYLAKVLSAILTLVLVLLFQLLISGYKNFSSEAYVQDILPHILPKVFYQSLANTMFFGSLWVIIGQWLRTAANRWMISLIGIYAAFSAVYLGLVLSGVVGQLSANSKFFKVLNVLYYQHLIFFADSPMLMASAFLAGSIILFAAGGLLFARRNFHPL